jgi:hypothetical protein
MIGMISIFTQHFEAGTTLAKKFTGLLKNYSWRFVASGTPVWKTTTN